MRNKGFTLIELLAIIVLLGIIAVITYPIINNVINNSEKETFKSSVEELINVTEIDYTANNRRGSVVYTLDGNSYTCDGCTKPVKFDGEIKGGKGTITANNGEFIVNIYNDYYEASLNDQDKVVVSKK